MNRKQNAYWIFGAVLSTMLVNAIWKKREEKLKAETEEVVKNSTDEFMKDFMADMKPNFNYERD